MANKKVAVFGIYSTRPSSGRFVLLVVGHLAARTS